MRKKREIANLQFLRLTLIYGVSTDYLLGRTSVRTRKNVELDQLGLSHKALVTLLSGKVNMQVFKELLRNILADSNHKKR